MEPRPEVWIKFHRGFLFKLGHPTDLMIKLNLQQILEVLQLLFVHARILKIFRFFLYLKTLLLKTTL